MTRLLAWMAGQDFAEVLKAGLLKDAEGIVVKSHRRLYETEGKPWSPPVAYRWLRYEDPDPVARLAAGVRKLRRRGARFDAEAVDKACFKASKTGYSN
jgi:hypothetical protein